MVILLVLFLGLALFGKWEVAIAIGFAFAAISFFHVFGVAAVIVGLLAYGLMRDTLG
jgi:hypothetical protein